MLDTTNSIYFTDLRPACNDVISAAINFSAAIIAITHLAGYWILARGNQVDIVLGSDE